MTKIHPNQFHEIIGKHVLIDNDSMILDKKRSHGSWIVDARTGKEYLDCFSQFSSQPLGWNHPKIIAQKERLSNDMFDMFDKLANPDILSAEYAEFVQKFSSITPDHKYHFYIDGGSNSIDNSLKTSFDYKAQKLGWNDDKVNNLNVIYLESAFHGRGGYALSTTNRKWDTTKTRLFPKFNWTKIPNPKLTDENYKKIEETSLEMAEDALKKNNVSAILIELIQGEGGNNLFSKEYLKELRYLATKYDALFIADEVQTGFTCGSYWAYQLFDIIPDIIVFGKKVQTAGICCTEKIDEVKNNVFKVHSRINSTFGGNNFDFLRYSTIHDIITEDNLINNSAVVGEYFLNKMKEFGLKNARGVGFMLAFDLETVEERDIILKKLNENMMILPCGEKSIRFRPHLTFSKAEVDIAMKFISDALH